MSLPRFFHKGGGAQLGEGRVGSMYLSIFVLVSPAKEKSNDLP